MTPIINLLFPVTIFLSFVPISTIALLDVSPINIVYYFFIICCILCFGTVEKRIPNTVWVLVVVFVLYSCLDFVLSKYKGEPLGNIYVGFRRFLLIIMFCLVAFDEKGFKGAFKLILCMMTLNIIFGILITSFGEPFQSIRDWVIGERRASILGEGHRISGFYSSIFGFSYMLAPAPLMAFTLYLTEKKVVWLFILILTMVAFILNAERSSALMAGGCLFHWVLFGDVKRFKGVLITITSVLLAVMLALNVIGIKKVREGTLELTLLDRLGESRGGEVSGRLRQQMAGLITFMKHPVIGSTDDEYEDTLYAQMFPTSKRPKRMRLPGTHNHYINIGIRTGLLGLALFGIFVAMARRSIKQFKDNVINSPEMRYFYLGSVYALIAVLGNGLFHNNGIFQGEITTWCILGLICGGSAFERKKKDEEL